MNKKALALNILFLCTLISLGFSQNLAFKTISVEDGLSANFIKSICKDKDGFIWLGTLEGLDRFDGTRIVSFSKKIPAGYESINTIAEDDSDNLWIGTDKGLLKFDKRIETFSVVKLDTIQFKISALYYRKDHSIYIGSSNGLYVLNTNTSETKHIVLDVIPFSKRNNVTGIFCPDTTKCWLSTLNGLFFYSPVGALETYDYQKNEYTCITGIANELFIGTKSDGMVIFNTDLKKFSESIKLDNNYILSVFADKKDRIFIGTDGGGLKIFSLNQNVVTTESHNINDPASISSDAIYSILIDENNTFWIGTYSGGLSYAVNYRKNFRVYSYADQFNSLNKHVRSLLFLPQSDMFVGTREGLYHIDKEKEKVYFYNAISGKRLRSNIILSLFHYKKTVLVGTYGGGISSYDLSSRSFSDFSAAPDFINGCIYAFERDDMGNLWIATLNGIFRYNSQNGKIDHFTKENSGLKSNQVFYIKFDSGSRLWAGTMDGFCVMEKGSQRFSSDIFPDSKVFSNTYKTTYIFEDSSINIWVCTEKGGLFLFNKNLKFIDKFSTNNGLPDNSVCAIAEDDPGQLWVSTLKGFCSFQFHTKAIRNYGLADGLPGLVFNSGSSYKSGTGELWFCNEKGLVFFNPDSLSDLSEKTRIHFTSFYLSGKEVFPGEKSPLKQSLVSTTKILLPNRSNNLGFRFVALNYLNPAENNYLCKLEGFDKEWRQLENNNLVFYDKLSAGKYTFKVKLANSKNIAEMQVIIKQSVFKSPYFFIFIFLLIAFAVYKLKTFLKNYKERTIALVMQQKTGLSGNDKYKSSKIQEEQGLKIKHAILNCMDSNKTYLNPELTLSDLARMINHSPHEVSQVINQYISQNFSDFINSYRVEEFKRRMELDDFSKYTLIALSEQCGFSSKTSFFRAFKKITGKTPSEYFKNYKKLKEQ